MSETPTPPRFGTDGIRGKAGTPPLDPTTLRQVGAALGQWLLGEGADRPHVLLGHDGRESAGWIRDALVAGLATANVAASDVGLVPTPALAYLTRTQDYSAGIMISASHNPARDNGVKIFGADGSKLADEAERAVERGAIAASVDADSTATCEPSHDLVASYTTFLTTVFADLDLAGHTIIVDAANGAGSEVAPEVLRRLGARVVTRACTPSGTNINDGVGALHPASLVDIVQAEKALLGLCLDGDGDRGIFVDDSGVVRNGDELMYAFARELKACDQLAEDTLVATVMSNLGLHRALEAHGVTVHTTPVGDRSVAQAMRAHGFVLGGEQSGHLIFAQKDHATGDGLFSALKLLSLPNVLTEGSSALFSGFRQYPQLLINVPVKRKPDLEGLPAVQSMVRKVEDALGRDGRVVLRYSGTEDLCRVMVEGPDEATVQSHAEAIAAAVRETLA